ncbi:predicted protein [Nematostella vectensis]|uniref:Uncharacterized protein n=1 Tax=Nematostella vectensis TaxID=45351 RepID=A7RV79_NEMVE|nr:predicted protein [Nematostella vectensis]|eukprot:XP_001636659.1 predicted protein [Nematostella vectensis]
MDFKLVICVVVLLIAASVVESRSKHQSKYKTKNLRLSLRNMAKREERCDWVGTKDCQHDGECIATCDGYQLICYGGRCDIDNPGQPYRKTLAKQEKREERCDWVGTKDCSDDLECAATCDGYSLLCYGGKCDIDNPSQPYRKSLSRAGLRH